MMQRIINDADRVVDDMLDGFCAANSNLVRRTDNRRVLASTAGTEGRVGIVTGGGSGHEPAFIGYLGDGMLDAVAVGEVFTSPSAQMFLDAFRIADSGHGVACLYGNYAGDNLNVRLAIKLAHAEGIRVSIVVANDDVLSAPVSDRPLRRGVAGEILMWKAAAAAARDGADLGAVTGAAQHAIDATRSVGVGLTSCTIPAVGHPNFNIDPGTMEVGIGHHGEPGTAVRELQPARAIAEMMCDTLLTDLGVDVGDDVVVLISGLGATPTMETYILYAAVSECLARAGLSVHRAIVGNYFTSLDMFGVTLTIMRLDDRLRTWIDRPVQCAAFRGLNP